MRLVCCFQNAGSEVPIFRCSGLENVPAFEGIGTMDFEIHAMADMRGEGHSLETGGKVGGGLELRVIK